MHDTALKNVKKPEILEPVTALKLNMALDVALNMAKASETDGKFITAASEIKKLATQTAKAVTSL